MARYKKEGVCGTPPTTIFYPEDVDRELEAALDRIVHDAPKNFKSTEESMRYLDGPSKGLPRHEW